MRTAKDCDNQKKKTERTGRTKDRRRYMMKKLISIISVLALSFGLVACGGGNDAKTISIGVTPVPHEEIVRDVVAPILEEQGWKVDIVQFNDYVQPNTSVEEGELDANYYQTIRYLQQQNADRGLHLVDVVGVHLEPMGVYSNEITSLDDLYAGATVAVPNDGSNESRAIKLLADNGFITLKETDDLYTLQHIETNPLGLEFVELEAANLTRSLEDVTIAVINGNYALEAGLSPLTDALVAEKADAEDSYLYINYVVVKEGNENSEKTKALVEAFKDPKVKAYIEEKYSGSVIPAF